MKAQSAAQTLPVVLGDSSAERLAALFDAHHQRLYRLARRLTPSSDDALDLLQETFLRAGRACKSIPAGAPDEEAWLVRVLINIRRDQWRKASVRKHHSKIGFGDSNWASGARLDPEAELIAKSTVWRALDVLSPRRRAIVVMVELEELSVAAIAALLGISKITVRWHLSMGKRELATILKVQMGDRNGT